MLLAIAALVVSCGGGGRPTPTLTPTGSSPTVSRTEASVRKFGPFVLVAPGEPSSNGAPQFGVDALRTGELSGVDAAARARSEASLFVDLPKEAYAVLTPAGFEVAGTSVTQDSSGRFDSWVLVGRQVPKPGMVELRAYTPTGPVAVTVFPESPVHTTETSNAVNGNPTITQFRTPMTDPYADQTVMWSQGSAVYVLHAAGPFSGDDLLAWARAISAAQQQNTVQLFQGGGNAGLPTVTTLPWPSADSLAKVSAAANFPVTLPAYVPPGFQLTEIDIPARPPAAINSSGLPFQAILKFRGANGGFNVEEMSARISPPDDPNQIIATPAPGVQVFKQAGNLATTYTLVTSARLIELGTGAPNPLGDDDAVRILTSVP